MNTVHYIMFRKKNIKLNKKIKSNQIKLDKIFENKIFVQNNILNAKLIALHYL